MNKDKLLRRLSSMKFAMWEIHLYMDTHPDDMQARSMYKEYKSKYDALAEEFEKMYGPLTLDGSNSDDWLKDPWPWDVDYES